MKKSHKSDKQDITIDELCKRYENEGIDYDGSLAYTEQRTREISARASARKLKREYVPDTSTDIDTHLVLQSIDQARYSNKNMKTDKKDNKIDKVQKNSNVSSKIKESARTAVKTWVPLEERHSETILDGKKTKIPVNVIVSIIIITISLFLIVSSMVLLGTAQREQNDLKDEIEELEFEIAELRDDIDRKNENADIEFFAEDVLGMIKQEHVNAEYIKSNKTDGVSKEKNESVSFATLIDWIFQQFK